MKKKKIVVAPNGVNQELFNSFKRKEQDFILMHFARTYSREQIMEKLYLETRQGYYKFAKKIREKLSNWQLCWQHSLQKK